MEKDEDKLVYKIHYGSYSEWNESDIQDSDSQDSDDSDDMKPPPVTFHPSQIVKISSRNSKSTDKPDLVTELKVDEFVQNPASCISCGQTLRSDSESNINILVEANLKGLISLSCGDTKYLKNLELFDIVVQFSNSRNFNRTVSLKNKKSENNVNLNGQPKKKKMFFVDSSRNSICESKQTVLPPEPAPIVEKTWANVVKGLPDPSIINTCSDGDTFDSKAQRAGHTQSVDECEHGKKKDINDPVIKWIAFQNVKPESTVRNLVADKSCVTHKKVKKKKKKKAINKSSNENNTSRILEPAHNFFENDPINKKQLELVDENRTWNSMNSQSHSTRRNTILHDFVESNVTVANVASDTETKMNVEAMTKDNISNVIEEEESVGPNRKKKGKRRKKKNDLHETLPISLKNSEDVAAEKVELLRDANQVTHAKEIEICLPNSEDFNGTQIDVSNESQHKIQNNTVETFKSRSSNKDLGSNTLLNFGNIIITRQFQNDSVVIKAITNNAIQDLSYSNREEIEKKKNEKTKPALVCEKNDVPNTPVVSGQSNTTVAIKQQVSEGKSPEHVNIYLEKYFQPNNELVNIDTRNKKLEKLMGKTRAGIPESLQFDHLTHTRTLLHYFAKLHAVNEANNAADPETKMNVEATTKDNINNVIKEESSGSNRKKRGKRGKRGKMKNDIPENQIVSINCDTINEFSTFPILKNVEDVYAETENVEIPHDANQVTHAKEIEICHPYQDDFKANQIDVNNESRHEISSRRESSECSSSEKELGDRTLCNSGKGNNADIPNGSNVKLNIEPITGCVIEDSDREEIKKKKTALVCEKDDVANIPAGYTQSNITLETLVQKYSSLWYYYETNRIKNAIATKKSGKKQKRESQNTNKTVDKILSNRPFKFLKCNGQSLELDFDVLGAIDDDLETNENCFLSEIILLLNSKPEKEHANIMMECFSELQKQEKMLATSLSVQQIPLYYDSQFPRINRISTKNSSNEVTFVEINSNCKETPLQVPTFSESNRRFFSTVVASQSKEDINSQKKANRFSFEQPSFSSVVSLPRSNDVLSNRNTSSLNKNLGPCHSSIVYRSNKPPENSTVVSGSSKNVSVVSSSADHNEQLLTKITAHNSTDAVLRNIIMAPEDGVLDHQQSELNILNDDLNSGKLEISPEHLVVDNDSDKIKAETYNSEYAQNNISEINQNSSTQTIHNKPPENYSVVSDSSKNTSKLSDRIIVENNLFSCNQRKDLPLSVVPSSADHNEQLLTKNTAHNSTDAVLRNIIIAPEDGVLDHQQSELNILNDNLNSGKLQISSERLVVDNDNDKIKAETYNSEYAQNNISEISQSSPTETIYNIRKNKICYQVPLTSVIEQVSCGYNLNSESPNYLAKNCVDNETTTKTFIDNFCNIS